jgi:hypothetical protein
MTLTGLMDETTHMMYRQHTVSFAYAYYYFALPMGRVLHDGWRSV